MLSTLSKLSAPNYLFALRFKRKGRSSRALRQIVWHYLQKSPLNFARFAISRLESSIVNLIYVKRNVFM
ncbi:hypothetical protein HMPREF1574_01323 [Gardnerella pickettii JCP7659]|nr:hypothetical protein HMPREF1574_01323 [Gardnerella pickettii JCP7659]